MISRMGLVIRLSADFKEFALFFMNIGRIVSVQATAKMSQLRQSMKLTGVIKARAAAAINPNTDKRSVCMVRVK